LHIGTARVAQYNVFAVSKKKRTTNQGFYILDIFGQHRLTDAQSASSSPKVQLLSKGNDRLHKFRVVLEHTAPPINFAKWG
jgi:hypothetical protein